MMSLRSNASTVLFLVVAIGGCSSNDNRNRVSSVGRTGSSNGESGSSSNTSGSSGGISLNPSSGSPDDPENECNSTLQVVYRDFKQGSNSPDFEATFLGDVVRRQLVKPELGADLKPQFRGPIGCPWDDKTPLDCANWKVETPVIASEASFNTWYNDVEGVNISFQREMPLTETPAGSGQYVFESTSFFPLGPDEGYGKTPNKQQNFHFTTEIHLKFGYVSGQKFTFVGDDDLWIFVNGKLALDLGSLHLPATGTIDFDKQAADLGIRPGQTYTMDVFHAERHTDGSNFRIQTNISCFTSVPVILK